MPAVGIFQLVGMHYQSLGHPTLFLAYGVLQVDDIVSVVRIVLRRVQMAQGCDNAFSVYVVNHRAVLWYLLLLKQVVGTEPVQVAHKQVRRHRVAGPLAYAVAHSAARAVGESEANHVPIVHPEGVGFYHPLRQYECLPASRRRQHKVSAALQVYYALLVGVGCGIGLNHRLGASVTLR